MTSAELRALIIREIARSEDDSTVHWAKVIGRVKAYPRSTHPHCNWEVRLTGSVRDMAVVERALDTIRPLHPFVDDE